MKKTLYKSTFLFAFSLAIVFLLWGECFIPKTTEAFSSWTNSIKGASGNKPRPTAHFRRQHPVSVKPVLTWTKVEGAVSYELEILTALPDLPNAPAANAAVFFSTDKIYVSGYNADLSDYPPGDFFYWRVRGLDIDRKPVGPFSDAEQVFLDRQQPPDLKPLPTSFFNQSAGDTLLYPVYAWIPVAGAAKYEVEILDDLPENPNGVTPSIHRIDSAVATGFDYYDESPRLSEEPFYWRVRGLDHDDNPVGVYSDAGQFRVNPKRHVTVATYGDSITHGGGSISYSPADWEYSYQHYLTFPTINLAKSGDTSRTMVERFDEDVLPFQPDYLIIMGGTNSLRGGVAAEDVIADLTQLKDKCLANNIRPVFLTLPPINPANIQKAFQQDTVPDWQERVRKVNHFIRTQVHVDVAREMQSSSGVLPSRFAVDGLHLDIAGKKRMASAINAKWEQITKLAWKNTSNINGPRSD